MQVCSGFGIFTDYNMIEGGAIFVLKHSTYNKGGRTAAKIGTGYMLGLGKREPVRQLKKAGVIFKFVQQHLQVHISGRKDSKQFRVSSVGFRVEEPETPNTKRETALANPYKLKYVPLLGALIKK